MTSIRIYHNDEWALAVLFCTAIDLDIIIDTALAIDVDPAIPHDNVAVINESDGSIMWDANSAAEYEEPDNIDSDMGFDPYEGCCTWDC